MAGAWLQKPKNSEFILQQEYKFLTTYYTKTLSSEPILSKAYIFEIYDAFYQYGINDKLTIGVQTKWFNYNGYIEHYTEDTPEYDFFEANELTLDAEYKEHEKNPFETKFFVQTSLWSNKNSIISFQPNISLYTSKLRKSIGASLLYGYSFKIGKRKAFINLEAGIDASHYISTKYEATLGYDLTKKYAVMLQSFNRENTKFYHPDTIEEEYYNDAKASLIYKYNKFISLQTGYSTNISQRNIYSSDSFITSIIIKF